jgi:hypothetical protein
VGSGARGVTGGGGLLLWRGGQVQSARAPGKYYIAPDLHARGSKPPSQHSLMRRSTHTTQGRSACGRHLVIGRIVCTPGKYYIGPDLRASAGARSISVCGNSDTSSGGAPPEGVGRRGRRDDTLGSGATV